MYALRQATSPLFGNLGAVVLPEHADATNYVFLNAHGDHEAQLRRACEQHVREALLTLGVASTAITPHRVDYFLEDFGVMTPIGEFPGGASLDLLFPAHVTKLGDDLVYSEEWRLLAIKNLVIEPMHEFISAADERTSIIVYGELRTKVGGACVVVDRSPPYRRVPVRLVGAALASYLNKYYSMQEIFHTQGARQSHHFRRRPRPRCAPSHPTAAAAAAFGHQPGRAVVPANAEDGEACARVI